jgi:hypothetical protein
MLNSYKKRAAPLDFEEGFGKLKEGLTLSCPMWRLCGILTLAIYISPKNGPIDLLLGKEMVLHVMAIISL